MTSTFDGYFIGKLMLSNKNQPSGKAVKTKIQHNDKTLLLPYCLTQLYDKNVLKL